MRKTEGLGSESCGRNSQSSCQGHKSTEKYLHDTVLSEALSSLLKNWVGASLWTAQYSNSVMCAEHLVLSKPDWKINIEWLSSLETKIRSLLVCFFPSPWKGILGSEPYCPVFPCAWAVRPWNSNQFLSHCNVFQVISKPIYVYKEQVRETQEKHLLTSFKDM